ncbi:MAG: hypothetical protein ACJATT_004853, partial [Myxococcota bacterium]
MLMFWWSLLPRSVARVRSLFEATSLFDPDVVVGGAAHPCIPTYAQRQSPTLSRAPFAKSRPLTAFLPGACT